MTQYQSFSSLTVGDHQYRAVNLNALSERYDLSRLPFCIKILLENLLRHEDSEFVTANDIIYHRVNLVNLCS